MLVPSDGEWVVVGTGREESPKYLLRNPHRLSGLPMHKEFILRVFHMQFCNLGLKCTLVLGFECS